jgi:hAT family C-terminal dimerisation region
MSAECERVFSSTKKLITSERNRLAEDIIEASECLKNWWDRGLIEQLDDGTEI